MKLLSTKFIEKCTEKYTENLASENSVSNVIHYTPAEEEIIKCILFHETDSLIVDIYWLPISLG